MRESVGLLRERLRRAVQYKLLYERQKLGSLEANRVFARMTDAIARRQQRLDDLGFRLQSLMRARLAENVRRVDLAVSRLGQHDLRQQLKMRQRELVSRVQALTAAARQSLMRRRSRLEQAGAKLAALSPVAILERGYSLIFDSQGALVKDAAQLAPGDPIQARLAHSELRARVESLRKFASDTKPGGRS
jgi:exodeoxyribonuclease VII large subunit